MLLTPLRSASDQYRRQQLITAEGLAAARAARYGTLPSLVEAVIKYQLASALESQRAAPAILEEQGISPDPVAEASVLPLLGAASDGRPLATLLDIARTGSHFDTIVRTQLADVARQSSVIANAVRPQADRYVRVVNMPACSRCVILAGREYRSDVAFQRHPRCDCTMAPSASDTAGDATADPAQAFDFYKPAAELDRLHPDLTVKMRQEAGIYSQEDVFTKAGAQAIRDGADMAQVVNARRGMTTAQVGGRTIRSTREGVTRRGHGYQAMKERGQYGVGKDYREHGARYFRTRSSRLMPETIYAVATSDADALRLLHLYGYVMK